METEKTLTLEQGIKLAELEARGLVLHAERLGTLDKRRHAREAWKADARKFADLNSKLETEPKFIADTIQRLTALVHECEDLTTASETGSALAGWTLVEKTWPSRRAKLETEIDALSAQIAARKDEESKFLKREAELETQIEACRRAGAKIIE